MIKILFVCLGNICRSPLAEGIFAKKVAAKGLGHAISCDSCGTSNYHIGEQPDPRTVANALENGLSLNHRARQFQGSDFNQFDYILAMDSSNLENAKMKMPGDGGKAKLHLIREFDTHQDSLDVPDPYYGGEKGFQNVFDILDRSCDVFLKEVMDQNQL